MEVKLKQIAEAIVSLDNLIEELQQAAKIRMEATQLRPGNNILSGARLPGDQPETEKGKTTQKIMEGI